MFENIVIELGEYKVDIAPILNALAKFVKAILEAYLPADLKDAVEEE
ncbi:MAG: hypothetical protein IJN88_09545 [Clostridia bacterium]|nr:hypothetical protein [Clostridia bacterium]